jgi:hypothetical protein
VALVEALRCKPEGRGFDFVTGVIHFIAVGLAQHLTEVNARNISWGEGGIKAASA